MEQELMQNYEVFRNPKSKEEFFNEWDQESYMELSEGLKSHIYSKYLTKCAVFNRDQFKCQNLDCESPGSHLTLHHIKWQKNGGEDKVRNGITLCKTCHIGFHKARKKLVFGDSKNVPSHIRGHIFQLEKPAEINWKKIKAEMRKLRKEVTSSGGHKVIMSFEQIILLIRWLFVPYYEMSEDDEPLY